MLNEADAASTTRAQSKLNARAGHEDREVLSKADDIESVQHFQILGQAEAI
jgi:hypothetical protein